MKKIDLINELSCFNDDDEIFIAFPSGDYWGSVLAKEITEIKHEQVVWSDYHNTNKVVDDEKLEKGYYDEEELKEVVMLG